MSDKTALKIGDTIRLLNVPKTDEEQRQQELEEGIEDAGWTANTIEQIIAQHPIVEIDTIDEYGSAWFTVTILVDGQMEQHSLRVVGDMSWELV